MADTLLRKELKEAILEQGLQDTNFFNGRLLTASDLARVQKASRHRDQLLAQTVGSGIVSGLEVSLVADATNGKPPILGVTKGLALNRSGQIIALPVNIEVTLAKEKPERIPPAGFFDTCEPIQQNGKPLPGKGAYLFVARPALDYRGSAPRRGFGIDAKVEDCDRDMLVEGVQFRLVVMEINQLENLSLATRQALTELLAKVETTGTVGVAAQNKLRNWLAHACFGTEELTGFIEDPFSRPGGISPFESYGAVDQLLERGLIDDCDVPLGLVCWTATGVKWVDMWSARRRLLTQLPSMSWPQLVKQRRLSEAEATIEQFHDQANFLSQKLEGFALVNLHAAEYFRFLPAMGILPVSKGILRGFNPSIFFKQPHRDVEYVDGQILRSLMVESAYYESIDSELDELVWLYQPWQNAKAIDDGDSIQPYIVFATGHMPHKALARLDLARWDYSHYADITAG